jgi:hypothetical protein
VGKLASGQISEAARQVYCKEKDNEPGGQSKVVGEVESVLGAEESRKKVIGLCSIGKISELISIQLAYFGLIGLRFCSAKAG